MSSYHFVGIAGIGMSGLAQLVAAEGHSVSGSDRYFDLGRMRERQAKLEAQGVRTYAQDGSGVGPGVDHVVVSSAIEEDNRDLQRARELGLKPIHRSSLLASLFHACDQRIAVTGSFGKTTIAGMIGWVLAAAGERPMVMSGGIMRNFENEVQIGNAVTGDGAVACVEADESDGTCVKYRQKIGVITGLARDHWDLDELHRIYAAFARNTSGRLVLSVQADASLFNLPGPRRVTFGLRDGDVRAMRVRFGRREVSFTVDRTRFRVRQIGAYSVFNALAAIAVLRELDVPDRKIEAGLRSFHGIARHMELVGRVQGTRIFDDFAHSPSKIEAAMEAVRGAGARRVLAVFQPHGFAPARFMRRELVEVVHRALGRDDRMFMLPIYYTGGTAARDVSSAEIAAEAAAKGAPVQAVRDRATLVDIFRETAREHDAVLVMGARDDSLTELCRNIADALLGRPRAAAPHANAG